MNSESFLKEMINTRPTAETAGVGAATGGFFLRQHNRTFAAGTSFGMEKKDMPYDGVITGFGKINGRTVAVYAQDFTVQGGSITFGPMRSCIKPMTLRSKYVR